MIRLRDSIQWVMVVNRLTLSVMQILYELTFYTTLLANSADIFFLFFTENMI